jgi:apolipoprotein N-acyltransferase
MEILGKQTPEALGWKKACLWVVLAAACFHTAYTSLKFPAAGLFIFGYAYFLMRLADQPNVRRAFYFGLVTGYLSYAPQAFFMWNIFSVFSVILWLVLAFWTGLFTAIVCGCIRRWGNIRAMWLIPVVWTGVEYFRSELYYLKFSWLNVGYAFSEFKFLCLDFWGMYGVGLLVFSIAAIICFQRPKIAWAIVLPVLILILVVDAMTFARKPSPIISLSGIQLEFPPAGILPKVLNQALAKNTNAQIFVLSEYTLDGEVPEALKDWCRENGRFLVVGGKDVVTNDVYYNTAFVVGTNGDIVFKQAKSVPIQFFHDGLPAPEQSVWNFTTLPPALWARGCVRAG